MIEIFTTQLFEGESTTSGKPKQCLLYNAHTPNSLALSRALGGHVTLKPASALRNPRAFAPQVRFNIYVSIGEPCGPSKRLCWYQKFLVRLKPAAEEADKTRLNPCLRAAVPTVANPIIASMRAKLEVCRNGHCLES